MEDRNPSPPPEFENDKELYRADSVGSTAISKQWVLTTLMDIINEVEKHSDKKDEVIEVSDDLQDSACKLWDICMDKEIAVYLLEFDIIEILYGVILKSKAPRLTEISVGILGNMACNSIACLEISKLNHLRSVVVALMSSPDTPTLLESVRLIKISISTESCCEHWMSTVLEDLNDFTACSQFILNSSTNEKLLGSLSEVLDMMFEKSNGVLSSCCNQDFVGAMLEAVVQQSEKDPSSSLPSLCHSLHVLHLISETDLGITVVETLRRNIAALLSSLFYQWMTSHPKVEYNNDSCMSASEVSVSCCLSLAGILLKAEDKAQKEESSENGSEADVASEEDKDPVANPCEDSGHNGKSEENDKSVNLAIDDEDRELIVKFSRSVVSAKGVISVLPVVSAIVAENGSSNEFKTPIHLSRNSPRVGTPSTSILGKSHTVDTPVQTPEIHSSSPSDRTPSRDADEDFSPNARERTNNKKSMLISPSATLCELANKVLKIAQDRFCLSVGESPRKGIV